MALCEYLIINNIQGYDCENPPVKGVDSVGKLFNRADIDLSSITYLTGSNWVINSLAWKSGKKGYDIAQSGKTPFTGTQQEMAEGVYANTITNTFQFVILKQDEDVAEQLFAIANGEFVAAVANKNGTYQIFGIETGLHTTAILRELYNDDTLAGWLVTMTEEGSAKGNVFLTRAVYNNITEDHENG